MPSASYELIVGAMRERRQVHCVYSGRRREVLPIILGHTSGREKLLTFQVGGASSKPLAGPGTRWRCLWVDELSELTLEDGPWQTSGPHSEAQSCVQEVDYDVNPDSPYSPRHRL